MAFHDIPFELPEGVPNLQNIATGSAITGKTINIPDLSTADGMDTLGAREFDDFTGYESRSFLTVPLQSFSAESIGVLQLLNAKDSQGHVVPFETEAEPLIEALASQAAVALENRYLLDEQEDLKKEAGGRGRRAYRRAQDRSVEADRSTHHPQGAHHDRRGDRHPQQTVLR
ncbi:MAG: hypothetical protein CMQ24_22445 [Gammaproteobacteria bacterium]|nr:hypothetical protein [Gammaproteobacteria bacterium]